MGFVVDGVHVLAAYRFAQHQCANEGHGHAYASKIHSDSHRCGRPRQARVGLTIGTNRIRVRLPICDSGELAILFDREPPTA